ncbi:MAG: ribosome hibernation-promoting factor, HPF/YfiA family [Candidatus Binatia bacterium]
MNFAIIGQNINLTESLLAHVERRIRCALGRFGKKIRHAAVQLTGLNGPNSRLDKQCKVTAFLSRGGKIIVKEISADFHTAINRALDRLERSIRLKIKGAPRLHTR